MGTSENKKPFPFRILLLQKLQDCFEVILKLTSKSF